MKVEGHITYFEFSNADNIRRVLQSIDNRQNLHREVQAMFGSSREESSSLYRVEELNDRIRIIVQSNREPNIRASKLFGAADSVQHGNIGKYYEGLRSGHCVSFKLETFPFYSFYNEKTKNPTRRFLKNEGKRTEWIRKKLADAGMDLISFSEADMGQHFIGKRQTSGHFRAYEFRGRARVVDEEVLARYIQSGIGVEKAYGEGLLLLS